MGDFFGDTSGIPGAGQVFALLLGAVFTLRILRYFLRHLGLG